MATRRKQQQAEGDHPLGLTLSEELSEEEWREIGSRLGVDAKASAFRIGDWIVHAEDIFDDRSKGRYAQAEEITGLANGTLRTPR